MFKSKEQCHLYRTRDQKLHDRIRTLAQERFTLGYPPKKDKDISINDAFNWEWIIYCAQNYSNEIVIVSRDSDYGIVNNNDIILNDWLRQEFKERVGRAGSIILTNRLAEGFKRASIQVTPQEVAEEEKHIQDTWLNLTNILNQAASVNINPAVWNTLANAASINIPPDIS